MRWLGYVVAGALLADAGERLQKGAVAGVDGRGYLRNGQRQSLHGGLRADAGHRDEFFKKFPDQNSFWSTTGKKIQTFFENLSKKVCANPKL